jgi:hypothetical protein
LLLKNLNSSHFLGNYRAISQIIHQDYLGSFAFGVASKIIKKQYVAPMTC